MLLPPAASEVGGRQQTIREAVTLTEAEHEHQRQTCIECGRPIAEGVVCEDCETEMMKDPQFWIDYCHFCGIRVTREQVERWMGMKSK